MKQKNQIVGLCLAALAVLVLLWLVLGGGEEPMPTQPAVLPTVPTQTQPTQTQPTLPEVGQLRLYTCDAALHPIYQQLAAEFDASTGLEVTVLPLPEGDCAQALAALLDSDAPPTLFCIHDQQTLSLLEGRLLDLSQAAATAQLVSPQFTLRSGEAVVALAADVQAYGLVYNTSLLGKAGFSRDYFVDDSAMENAVRHISDYRGELGFSAFGTLDLSDEDHDGMACLLWRLYQDPQQMRRFVDLYRSNSIKSGDATEQFLQGKTAFLLGGTEDYDRVAALADGAHNLDILPMMYPDGAKMPYVCSHYWAVSAGASEADRAVALAFLQWLVTAGQAGTPVDQLGLMSPFADATYYGNVLQRKLRGYMADGQAEVTFPRCQQVSQQQLSSLSQALQAYVAGPNDENWAAVAALLAEMA